MLAPNPGPMTLEGTNTWVLSGGDGAIVIDPGPDDERHLAAVLEAAGPVRLALLTHGHADHSAGAARFAELAGCPVRAYDERFCLGAPPLSDGEVLEEVAVGLRVLHVPGHTADSVAFLVPASSSTEGGRLPDDATSTDALDDSPVDGEVPPSGSRDTGAGSEAAPRTRGSATRDAPEPGGVLLTGDTVLGRGTTVVAHPDGALGPYLDSLRRLLRLAEKGVADRLLPGHGPVIEEPRRVLTFYLDHRKERLAQVEAALQAGARTPEDVVRRVYADIDPALWPAAEQSVRAQLEYLAQRSPSSSRPRFFRPDPPS